MPRQILLLCTAVAVVAALVLAMVMGSELPAWQVTSIEFSEWGSATVLALVASGLGMGLYWQTSLPQVQQQSAATATVLPIWIAQLLAVVCFCILCRAGTNSSVCFGGGNCCSSSGCYCNWHVNN